MSNATEHEAGQSTGQGVGQERERGSGRHRAAAPVDSGRAVAGRHRDASAEPSDEEPVRRRWFSRR